MTALLVAALLAAGPAPSDAVVVEFVSQQCVHCRSMEPVIGRLAAAGVPVQAVDVDQQPELARQYQIRGVPTFVGVSGGRETGRILGPASYEQLVQLYRAAAGGSLAQLAGAGMPEAAGGAAGSGPAGGAVTNGGPARMDGAALVPTDDRHPATHPMRDALAATVRLRVEDASGYGFGTGTIIDTHENEALVITCGHLFRESQGKGTITADLFAEGAKETVPGQLIAYDLERDVALVSVRAGRPVRPVLVAPPGHLVRSGDRVFTIGCDKGADPSIRPTHITAVNKYRGRPNYTAAGQPVDGRSGGGLFTSEGLLIGICNAADPADDEGLYAGLASIHWQLDQIGQAEIYQRAGRQLAAGGTAAAPGLAVAQATEPAAPAARETPALAATMPTAAAGLAAAEGRLNPAPAALGAAAGGETLPLADDDTEIVFIVRSKRKPEVRSEVFVVDQAPPELLSRIAQAARTSGQQRTALAQGVQPANRRPLTLPPTVGGSPPVVRGQSSDY